MPKAPREIDCPVCKKRMHYTPGIIDCKYDHIEKLFEHKWGCFNKQPDGSQHSVSLLEPATEAEQKAFGKTARRIGSDDDNDD